MHKLIINSAKLKDFKPLSMPNPAYPLYAILPNYTNIKDLRIFFNIFIKIKDFKLIIANINKYAKGYSN
jgi:hypothetical protein